MLQEIKILIVDDHPVVRQGMTFMINSKPGMTVVGEAKDGLEGIKLAKTLKPDVILMDLVMAECDGITAIKQIIAENRKTHILVLTSFSDDDKVFAAIKAGAIGFLLKDSSPGELIQAILDVYEGKPSFPPSISLKLIDRIQNEESHSGPNLNLTTRELNILSMIAEGLSNKAIAAELCLSEGTVRAHVSSILNKLGLENRTQVVIYAIRHNIIKP